MRKVLGLLLLLSVVSAAWAQERQDTIVVSRTKKGDLHQRRSLLFKQLQNQSSLLGSNHFEYEK